MASIFLANSGGSSARSKLALFPVWVNLINDWNFSISGSCCIIFFNVIFSITCLGLCSGLVNEAGGMVNNFAVM